jgi:hypothetical protein
MIRRVLGEHPPASLQQSGISGSDGNLGDLHVNSRRAGIYMFYGVPQHRQTLGRIRFLQSDPVVSLGQNRWWTIRRWKGFDDAVARSNSLRRS